MNIQHGVLVTASIPRPSLYLQLAPPYVTHAHSLLVLSSSCISHVLSFRMLSGTCIILRLLPASAAVLCFPSLISLPVLCAAEGSDPM